MHRILLTFDDGPRPAHTLSVLDELARRGLSAVFFVLGEQLELPGAHTLVERAAREGHFIGNHGYAQQNLTGLTDEEIRSSFRRTEALIGRLDRGVKLWRPPFGERDSRVESVLASLGYTRMLWNIDSLDWRPLPVSEWMDRVLDKVHARNHLGFRNSVCLFHDSLENTAREIGGFLDRVARIPDVAVARYNPCHPEGISLPEEAEPPRTCLLDPCDAVGFEFDGSRVLARPGRSALYILNETASFLWDRLSGGASEPETARYLAERYGIANAAGRDLAAALSNWRATGLIGPKAPEMEDPGPWPVSTETVPRPAGAEFQATREYGFLDFSFTIRYHTRDIAAAIHPRFANLESAARGRASYTFEITAESPAVDHAFILAAGGSATRHESLAALSYHLFFSITRRAHPGLELMACLHSALATYGEGSVAFVANNGSGKSTLVAALASAGMRVCSDDRLFLDFASGRPAATPNSIGLKRGSWPALQARYPGILDFAQVRIDDDDVRFILAPPAAERLLPPVTHVFFPRYDARAATAAHLLSPLQAIQRVAASEGWISSEPSKLEAFLGWLGRVSCYELPFSDLDAAVGQIAARIQERRPA